MKPVRAACLTALAVLLTAATAPVRDAAGFPAPDRPVASVVSPIWATEPERDARRETQQVFAAMDIKPGMTVADVGAGSGFYTVRLSPVVGPAGKVLAEDITPSYLADLQKRVTGLKLANVTVVQGDVADAKLPAASVDIALLIHMYHEIGQPYGLMYRLAASMKPGGRVGIVDRDAATPDHGTPPSLLRCEMEAVGYRQISVRTLTGDVGYLAIFAAPAVSALPRPQAIVPCKLNG